MSHSIAHQRNPYVIGRPLNEPQLFFGREGLFRFIEDNLRQGIQVILLHGQRRIGKSSVILNISNFVAPDRFVFVSFDLEHHSQKPLSRVLAALATEIIEQTDLNPHKIKLPLITDLERDPSVFSSQFLPQIYKALGSKDLVLLLDEFDALSKVYSNSLVEHFFPHLSSIIKRNEKLFIILFVGRQSVVMPNLLNLFKNAPYQEIGLLDELSAKRLITEPAKGILEYDSEAIKVIVEMSAGHPYFTQVICFALFGRARERENWKVSREDVEGIIDKAIELAEAGLAWFWDGLSELEQVVFSAVAEAQKIAVEQDKGFPEDPLELLKSYEFIQTKYLTQAAKQLVDTSFLDSTGRRVKIEFVRRWLMLRHPLRQKLQILRKLEQQEVYSFKEVTDTPRKLDKKQNELLPNKQVLQLSSNHLNRSSSKIKVSNAKLILLGGMILIAAIAALVGISVYQLRATLYLEDRVKRLGVSCFTSKTKISRGECTFFANPDLPNDARKWGIEDFKKGDYDKAVKRFKEALKKNPNDSEVLIYYNNALARERNSPLTLAVIAPMNQKQSPIAREILRGVALAQDEFNRKQGLNGRLLQIAIANDTDNPEQAKQIAAELVKDTSVLGAIGHYSSDTTKSALPEYEQAGVPIISPSSMSTRLEDEVFFRTVPSDTVSEKRIAANKLQGGDISRLTAASFDATQAFIQALRSSPDPSRKTVLEELRQIKF